METTITLYTHPSTWHGRFEPATTPHDRIAGLEVHGQRLWQDLSQQASENKYQRTDTEARSLTVPTIFAKRVAGYFYDFYANPLKKFNPSRDSSFVEQASNCHRFAITIHTGQEQDYLSSFGTANEIVSRRKEIKLPQKFGQLAVIGASNGDKLPGLPGEEVLHTMVSLGEAASNMYIQVACYNGNLSLTTLQDSYSIYVNKFNSTSKAFCSSAPQIQDSYIHSEKYRMRLRRAR